MQAVHTAFEQEISIAKETVQEVCCSKMDGRGLLAVATLPFALQCMPGLHVLLSPPYLQAVESAVETALAESSVYNLTANVGAGSSEHLQERS